MGLFNKLWNWVRGKGFNEEKDSIEERLQTTETKTEEQRIPEPPKKEEGKREES